MFQSELFVEWLTQCLRRPSFNGRQIQTSICARRVVNSSLSPGGATIAVSADAFCATSVRTLCLSNLQVRSLLNVSFIAFNFNNNLMSVDSFPTRSKSCVSVCMRLSCSEKLTNPAVSYDGEGFRRSSSNSSLNSIFSPEGDPHIRTCNECRLLLERRDEQMSQRAISPVIVQLYEVRLPDWVVILASVLVFP